MREVFRYRFAYCSYVASFANIGVANLGNFMERSLQASRVMTRYGQ